METIASIRFRKLSRLQGETWSLEPCLYTCAIRVVTIHYHQIGIMGLDFTHQNGLYPRSKGRSKTWVGDITYMMNDKGSYLNTYGKPDDAIRMRFAARIE